ncbi:MAG: bifunctional folylpolyglutamate synthase/dihydrofolate synthase [bacterium]
MDYRQTLEWLYSQLPMYQRIGAAAYKANLDTTINLLNELGNPQEKFRAVHIAGTNGKGSVAHILSSILQEAGYKTGLYTSPHLRDFRERIRIDGQMITEEKAVAFVEQHRQLFEKLKPSFFEMTVAMAYDHFAGEQVDIAILETGMGGRLDSTNVCHPLVTVITNIGYDHTQFLGDTLEKIAGEKAGIIKQGVPLVIGKTQPEIKGLFEEEAKRVEVEISFADEHFELREIQTREKQTLSFDVWKDGQLYLERLESPLLGTYQSENMATTLQVTEILNRSGAFSLDTETIRKGIEDVYENTGFTGRWQLISNNPLIIADTAHNPEGIQAIVNQLMEMNYDTLHFVFGMVSDKDPDKILYLLPKNARYYFCKPNIPRGMDVEILREQAFKAGLRGESHHTVHSALNSAMNNAGINDLVFIGGSTFVVAEVI